MACGVIKAVKRGIGLGEVKGGTEARLLKGVGRVLECRKHEQGKGKNVLVGR